VGAVIALLLTQPRNLLASLSAQSAGSTLYADGDTHYMSTSRRQWTITSDKCMSLVSAASGNASQAQQIQKPERPSVGTSPVSFQDQLGWISWPTLHGQYGQAGLDGHGEAVGRCVPTVRLPRQAAASAPRRSAVRERVKRLAAHAVM
jgi:hypothetical protein